GELEVGDAHAAHHQAVAAALGGRLEAGGAGGRDQVVLVGAVAAHAHGTGQPAALEERHAAGRERHAVAEPGVAVTACTRSPRRRPAWTRAPRRAAPPAV